MGKGRQKGRKRKLGKGEGTGHTKAETRGSGCGLKSREAHRSPEFLLPILMCG